MTNQWKIKDSSSTHFLTKVTFYSTGRKTVPEAGYRPHLVMDHDPEREYLGVVFYDLEVDQLDITGYGMCACLYEEEGVNYLKMQKEKTFTIMEGPHIVGTGKIVEITE